MAKLGFKVTEDMAEFTAGHNGLIRSDIYDKLLDRAVEIHKADPHQNMNMAITDVLTSFWKEWKAL